MLVALYKRQSEGMSRVITVIGGKGDSPFVSQGVAGSLISAGSSHSTRVTLVGFRFHIPVPIPSPLLHLVDSFLAAAFLVLSISAISVVVSMLRREVIGRLSGSPFLPGTASFVGIASGQQRWHFHCGSLLVCGDWRAVCVNGIRLLP